MFTIDIEEKKYPHIWMAIAVARAWMIQGHRSMTIFKDGKAVRFLRY